MITLLIILEIIIICLGASVFLYRPQMMVSETICSGIIVTLLTLSFLYQTVFLIGVPQLAFIFEGMLIIASLILLKRRSNYLRLFQARIIQFYQGNKLVSILLGITLIYLLLQTLLLPPTGPDSHSYHIPRVLLFQQEKSLYLENIPTLRQAIFPVGWNILNHGFLRFYTDSSLGIFNFLIYIAIGLGIYALSRKITSQKIAIVTTLVIVSMPQIVLASQSVSTDIPLAGLSVCCFLILFRLEHKFNISDVILLILVASFGLSIKLTFLLFLAPFILLSSYLLVKKHTFNYLIKFIISNWFKFVVLIFPVTILSQIWLYIHNFYFWGGWSGPPDYVNYFQQADGLRGAIANLIRYLFESVDLMLPTNLIGDYSFQIKPSNILQKIYSKLIHSMVGDAGILSHIKKFKIDWFFHESFSWYGIFGFLLSIPCLIYSTFQGKKIIKIVGLILLCFFGLVCYKISWSPWRGRYFALFFVSSGIGIAYTLDSLKYKLKSKLDLLLNFIIFSTLITFLLVIVYNEHESLIALHKINPDTSNLISKHNFVFINEKLSIQINAVRKRQHHITIQELNKMIEPSSKLALLGQIDANFYIYLLALPSVNIIPIHSSSYPDLRYRFGWKLRNKEFTNYQFPNPLQSNPDSFDYLLCLDVVNCSSKETNLPHKSRQLIWSFEPSLEQRGLYGLNYAQLFKLN